MKALIPSLALCASLLANGTSQAALIDRGGGLIYDTDLNVTWLQNAYATGLVTWSQANTWASNLSYYDSVRGLTYNDWRLPTSLQPDTCGRLFPGNPEGFNCTGSEMGHLYYNELGGTGAAGIFLPSIDPNLVPFTNLQLGAYWSSSFKPGSNSALAFHFDFGGYQDWNSMDFYYYALAVRSGDVAVVPVPAAAWLLSSGLLSLIGVARRKAA